MFTQNEIKTLERASKILLKKSAYADFITSSEYAKQIFKTRLAHLEREEFHVLYLNNQHAIIKCTCEFVGTINAASVYPREILKKALALNAASIIIAHNHPSGSLNASQADINITRRLQEVLNLVDIQILDHIIVGYGGGVMAFSDNGLMS